MPSPGHSVGGGPIHVVERIVRALERLLMPWYDRDREQARAEAHDRQMRSSYATRAAATRAARQGYRAYADRVRR